MPKRGRTEGLQESRAWPRSGLRGQKQCPVDSARRPSAELNGPVGYLADCYANALIWNLADNGARNCLAPCLMGVRQLSLVSPALFGRRAWIARGSGANHNDRSGMAERSAIRCPELFASGGNKPTAATDNCNGSTSSVVQERLPGRWSNAYLG